MIVSGPRALIAFGGMEDSHCTRLDEMRRHCLFPNIAEKARWYVKRPREW